MGRAMNRAARILAAVVTISTVCSSSLEAQVWFFGKNKVQYKDFRWQVLKTPHFDIHFDEGYRELAARTAVVLEHGYMKLSEDFSHRLSWRIPVILYGSHSDFQQTNVTWSLIPEGVQAFAEPLRKRMVLHYGGSNADFAATTIHELVHIFTYDIVYGGLLKSVFSRNMLFQIPLWFAEGLAEYYSIGYDLTAEMFMRDATVFDYLINLDQNYGYMAYKSGQAAVYYIRQTYGPEKVIEIMDHLHNQRSMELALRSSLGISVSELSREWKKGMRKLYWPLYSDKKESKYYGRKLTDHIKNHNYLNTKPVFSPDGEYIVYFSDRGGLDGIYLMNALTGKVEKKLISGSMSTRFESIRSMKSDLTFSPDGESISFVAKSHGRDKLFVAKVPQGEIVEELSLPLDFFYSPEWSPDGRRIVLVGSRRGQTDLYVYSLPDGSLEQITDDLEDEEGPTWFPDGERVAYSRISSPVRQPAFALDSTNVERITGVDFRSRGNFDGVGVDIWSIDLNTGEKELLIGTSGSDRDAIVIAGGEELIFTSDESGITNLYRGGLEAGSYYRFTDILGGLFSPAYCKAKDRLAFAAFNSAGYDIFVMEGFFDKSKISYSTGGPVVAGDKGFEEPDETEEHAYRQTGIDEPDSSAPSSSGVPDSLAVAGATGTDAGEEEFDAEGRVFLERRGGLPREIVPHGEPHREQEEIPEFVVEEDSKDDIHPDTLEAIRAREKKKSGTVQPYRIKFSPDYIGNGMGLYFSTGFGFGLTNQIAFSDLMGDHHLYLSFNLYRSLEDSDLMISYYYLKKRIDYAFGVFQFKNYLSSRVSSIGETFLDYRFFTERNYGVFGTVSFPFSMFTRLDLEFQGFISEKEFFDQLVPDESNPGFFVLEEGEKYTRRLFQPSLSIVHDSAYFGAFGPVIGSRWMVSLSRALNISGDDISRTTAFVDYRKYLPLYYRNYLAFRAVGAASEAERNEDRRYFFLGGPLTMRGYDYLQFSGPRMALFNLEYRFPLVDALIFGWPGRWGITNIGGTFFIDSGAVWGEDTYIEKLPGGIKPRRFQDVEFYSDFGTGFYMRFSFLILNFQLGWPTDFSRTGSPVFHFFIGPMF